MKASTIFYKVYGHLLEQGRRSAKEDGACQYRGANGMKCAVGVLISGKNYKPEMEGMGVPLLKNQSLLPPELIEHEKLLTALQEAHDSNIIHTNNVFNVQSLHENMRCIAMHFNIKFVEMELV
jgi:hypothetical protein